MATKITIIPVNLGYDVQDLIAEGVEELTGQAKRDLETAIEVSKERDALKARQNAEKSQAVDSISLLMGQAYDKIEQAKDRGVHCNDVLGLVSEVIPNSSAFTLRMKKLLRDRGNPFALSRVKINGEPHYIFIPFNQQ